MTSVAPRQQQTRPAPTDSYVLVRVLLFMMVCVTLDTRDFLSHGGKARYVLLVIPFGVTIFIWNRKKKGIVRRLSVPDRILAVLTLVGLAGALYGTFVLHTSSTTLPVFLPMTVAFAYLVTLYQPTDQELRKVLRALAMIGLLYTFMNALANSGVATSIIAAKVYRNSQVFFIFMGIAAAISAKRWIVLSLILLLGLFVFATYPSGTDVVVTLVTILTFWVTRPKASRFRPYVVVGLGLVILALAVANLGAVSSTASSYFGVVGKRDNTNTRLALWQGGIDEFQQSPIYGNGFAGELTILVYRQAGDRAAFKAPFHDDYIMLLALGGVIGLGLALWWLIATEQNVLRRYRAFLTAGELVRANTLRTLLVGFNVFFAAAFFNPGLSSVGRGATVFAIYAMMMIVGEPARRNRIPAAGTGVRPRGGADGGPT
jgi:O-antigen ligase/polysaccharide polymerase Wzy-like membrane protein